MVFTKVGAWKNFDDLEESLTLVELEKLVNTITEEKKETNIFLAGLQGVDLSSHYPNPVEDKRREIERRAAEKRLGARKAEMQEFSEFDIDFEIVD